MPQRMHAVLLYTALLGVFIAMSPHDGIAQQAAFAPIITATPTPIENATNIRAQPLALLAKFPDAGPDMARFVAQQLTQQPGLVDAMLSIVKDTSPAQASAMGAGMVRAVRVLNAKQPASARVIAQKVMRSDNKYLTTTFASLGPRYAGNAVFVAPASLPPREALASGDVGLGMGSAWRMGPAENEDLTPRSPERNSNDIAEGCSFNSNGYTENNCRGMIVAIMKSDAALNGAVSTSPTI